MPRPTAKPAAAARIQKPRARRAGWSPEQLCEACAISLTNRSVVRVVKKMAHVSVRGTAAIGPAVAQNSEERGKAGNERATAEIDHDLGEHHGTACGFS